jgi:outer membrane receptor protein involved in Fe transport
MMIAALCLPLAALAQEEENSEEDTEEVSTETRPDYLVIVEETMPKSGATTAKVPIPVQEIPVSVSVVPSSLIQLQNGNFLNDALRNISGINVQTGFGVFDFFVMRGFDSLACAQTTNF